MQQKINAIKNLLSEISGGIIKISDVDAAKLISICSDRKEDVGEKFEVKIHKYNGQSTFYDLYRTVTIDQEQFNDGVLKAIKEEPEKQFYQYLVSDSNGIQVANIYTASFNLFN